MSSYFFNGLKNNTNLATSGNEGVTIDKKITGINTKSSSKLSPTAKDAVDVSDTLKKQEIVFNQSSKSAKDETSPTNSNDNAFVIVPNFDKKSKNGEMYPHLSGPTGKIIGIQDAGLVLVPSDLTSEEDVEQDGEGHATEASDVVVAIDAANCAKVQVLHSDAKNDLRQMEIQLSQPPRINLMAKPSVRRSQVSVSDRAKMVEEMDKAAQRRAKDPYNLEQFKRTWRRPHPNQGLPSTAWKRTIKGGSPPPKKTLAELP
jgi:hypothetical protein